MCPSRHLAAAHRAIPSERGQGVSLHLAPSGLALPEVGPAELVSSKSEVLAARLFWEGFRLARIVSSRSPFVMGWCHSGRPSQEGIWETRAPCVTAAGSPRKRNEMLVRRVWDLFSLLSLYLSLSLPLYVSLCLDRGYH